MEQDSNIYGNVASVGELNNTIKVTDEEGAYLQYCGYSPDSSKKFLSPFQKESNPSFYFYPATKEGFRYYFVCYSSGNRGNILTLCMQLFNDSYREAVNRLINDGFAEGDLIKADTSKIQYPLQQPKKQFTKIKNTDIKIIPREFTQIDKEYWDQYGLDYRFLEQHNVKPCKEVWFNKGEGWKIWVKGNNIPVYRYMFGDRYKIYNPYNVGDVGKWLSNVHGGIIQGFQYLPEAGGELLVITKAYKDVLLLRKEFDLDSIAFQSEQIIPSDRVVNYFLERYASVYLLYDNDIPGKNASGRFIDKYPTIENVVVPEETNSKDISDFYKDYGKESFRELMLNMLK